MRTQPQNLKFNFDEEKHLYFLNDQIIPGTTEILSSVGLKSFNFQSEENNEFYRARGTYGHGACELFDKNILDIDTLDSHTAPIVQAWKSFRIDFGFIPELIEYRGASNVYKYGFTLDRVGIITLGPYAFKRALVDIKTGAIEPYAEIQTAGYEIGYAEHFPKEKIDIRLVLHLKDGKYRVKPCVDKNDRNIFLSCLTIHNYKILKNIRGEK